MSYIPPPEESDCQSEPIHDPIDTIPVPETDGGAAEPSPSEEPNTAEDIKEIPSPSDAQQPEIPSIKLEEQNGIPVFDAPLQAYLVESINTLYVRLVITCSLTEIETQPVLLTHGKTWPIPENPPPKNAIFL